jgi:hypothetical protein
MPTSSFDTFFACAILIAAALIATAFLGSTMQARIVGTEDINKNSYLKAIAEHTITNPGVPVDWGTSSSLPVDFGLAESSQAGSYMVDMDKISRLNSLNTYALSYIDVVNSAKLSNVALGISVSQLLNVNVSESSNHTVGADTSFTLTVSTSIDSKPSGATLRCYAAAENFLNTVNSTISDSGVGHVTIQIPTSTTSHALLILFARSSIDDRITSYTIYNFAQSTQESTPPNTDLALSPQNYILNLNDTASGLTVQNTYVFSYSYQQTLPSIENSQTQIPKLIDKSPLILVACGFNGSEYFQEWASYPQVPLRAGANFEGSEQNIFSYLVTVDGVLCRLDLSLGDLPK